MERLLLYYRDSRKPTSTLLYGVPGIGKSFVLEKLAKEYRYTYSFVSACDFKSDLHGQSETKLKNIFNEACKDGPGILVIDEVDSMISNRDGKVHEDSEVSASIKNLLLNLLSGTEAKGGLFVFFTTNHPWKLDKAFINRMSLTEMVKPPTRQELYQFFMEQSNELGYQCTVTFPEFNKLDLDNWDYRRVEALLTAAPEKMQLRAMDAPHVTYLSRSPIRVTGCYCPGTCDRTDKQLRDFKSEQIRCGTITFSDISEAKEEGNLRSTTNNDDVEKLNNFKKYGRVPEEKYRDKHSRDQEQNLPVSCQGQDGWEWMGLMITVCVVSMALFLFAYLGIL